MVCKFMSPTSSRRGLTGKIPMFSRFIGGGENLSLELEREPNNQYDSNAIKVIGVVRGLVFKSRYHIGYVPADMAKKLVLGKFWPNVAANLRMVEAREYTHVKFDLLGPAGGKRNTQPSRCECRRYQVFSGSLIRASCRVASPVSRLSVALVNSYHRPATDPRLVDSHEQPC